MMSNDCEFINPVVYPAITPPHQSLGYITHFYPFWGLGIPKCCRFKIRVSDPDQIPLRVTPRRTVSIYWSSINWLIKRTTIVNSTPNNSLNLQNRNEHQQHHFQSVCECLCVCDLFIQKHETILSLKYIMKLKGYIRNEHKTDIIIILNTMVEITKTTPTTFPTPVARLRFRCTSSTSS